MSKRRKDGDRFSWGMTAADARFVLGLKEGFGEEEMKKAYYDAAWRTHPDHGGNQDAWQEVNVAYTVAQKHVSKCPACGGTGKVVVMQGFIRKEVSCAKCQPKLRKGGSQGVRKKP